MANGIINLYKFLNIENEVGKILKLWVKYDYQKSYLQINSRFSLEVAKKVLYIRSNGERVIEIHLSPSRYVGGIVLTSMTLGLADFGRTRFLTTDKTVVNNAFIRELEKALKESLPCVEKQMKSASMERWG